MQAKVLIFSMPRCGTTLLQHYIHSYFRIPNLVEPFNDASLGFNPASDTYSPDKNPYQWLKQHKSFVTKLLALNTNINLEQLVNEVPLDQIIVLTRDNLTDCCLSLCLAEKTLTYHYKQTPNPTELHRFECSTYFVEKKWAKLYNHFKKNLEWLKQQRIPHTTISYEQLISGASIDICGTSISVPSDYPPLGLVNANIDYRYICSNYDEVTQWIDQWTN